MNIKTQKEKDEIIREWRKSGMPITHWAKMKNIPVTTLCGWKQQVEKRKKPGLERLDFIALDEAPKLSAIELEYQGIKIRLSDWTPETLIKCITALKEGVC